MSPRYSSFLYVKVARTLSPRAELAIFMCKIKNCFDSWQKRAFRISVRPFLMPGTGGKEERYGF